MLAIVRFDAPSDRAAFVAQGELALGALSRCDGYLGGELARSTDEPQAWVLCTRWANVGSYRRALSVYDVKLHATPFMYQARDDVSGFEPVLSAGQGGVIHRITGDLAEDSTTTAVGDFGSRSHRAPGSAAE